MTFKCLHAASEVAGFAKTGGLADVAASLPVALQARGIETVVVMPLYAACRTSKQGLTPTDHRFRVPMGERMIEGRLWRSTLPNSAVPVYLIEQPALFERDDPGAKRGLYQYADDAGRLADYADNSARFGFFARAILETLRLLDYWPDILHLHDWQTGLTPVYLREIYQHYAKHHLRDRYQRIRTFFTIHNLAYQGVFWHYDVPMLGLPWRLFTLDKLEFYRSLNFLKAGLVYADRLTTVSPTYAREIQTTLLGCGLHGVLMQRSRDLVGIVNGIDDQTWNPETDAMIAATYNVNALAGPEEEGGKSRCKTALQKHFGLDRLPRTPLFGVVSRLAAQKGFDLIEKVVPGVLRQGAQLAVLGDGDKIYRDLLLKLKGDFPRQVGVHLGYSEPLAHQIEAGADIFLMPSQYEPCGLNQLYSLRYGTVPIVHATGGLADTVVDATAENVALARATGFAFMPFTPAAFGDAIERCLRLYHDEPARWRTLQQIGMLQDWSWRRSATEYERLYRQAASEFV
ncbi:MAG: glycogen synthase GlgA [Planctomycetes bacterium]|nr:glycogen synthase GlgA [Planctomycetota bacterium]